MNRRSLWIFIILLSIGIGARWYFTRLPPSDTTEREAFFEDPHFMENIFDNAKLRPLDTIVERIRTVVPLKWRGLACEGVYYRLPHYTHDSVYFQYLDLCEAAFPEDSVRAFAQLQRGELFTNQLRYDTAMFCLQDSYVISEREGRSKRAADAKVNMGVLALQRTDYPEATRQFLETYQIIKSFGDYNGGRLFNIYLSIGKAYRGGNDYAMAQVWHKKAWAYALLYDNMEGFKILSADAVAENYLKLNQLDSAQTMIDTAFYYQYLFKNNYEEANRYCILAEIQVARGNCSTALSNFKEAITRNKQTDKPLIVSRYDKGLATAYACLGRLDSAVVFYKKALNTPDTISQVAIYDKLATIYGQKGDYAPAFKHRTNSRLLSNHTFTAEKDKEIGRLQVKNELLQQQKEAQYQQKLLSGSILTGVLAFVFMLYIHFSRRRIAEKEKQLLHAQALLNAQAREKAEAELVVKQTELNNKEAILEETTTALEESTKQLDIKNDFINALQLTLTDYTNTLTETGALLNLKILTKEDWSKFLVLFNVRFPNFIERLKSRFLLLSIGEIRLFLLIKTGFDTNEVANVLGIAPSSVYMNRKRLRKKLGLAESMDLEAFVRDF